MDGEVNPVRDLDTIAEELRLKDEDQCLKNFDKIEKAAARGEKKLKAEYVSTPETTCQLSCLLSFNTIN